MTTTTMSSPEVTEAAVREARAKAVEAGLVADELEAKARRARRTATALNRHYEDLLSILQGQLTIEDAS